MAEYPIIDPAPTVRVLAGDCLTVLRTLPDASVHAVVTDPPYGLSEVSSAKLTTALTAWVNDDRESVPDGRGFMGKAWDAFVPPPAVWDECLRVLVPGGHLVAFAGSRTYDLMGLSIRLAGFEIRDGLQWLYGSGFPKGQDVGKAIDKAAGATREVVGVGADNAKRTVAAGRSATVAREGGDAPIGHVLTAPATDDARRWDGWNTALKPGHEPIVLARKPLVGTVAGNVLAHGAGAINVDGCRVHGGDAPAGRLRHGGGSAVSGSMSGPLDPDVRPAAPAGRWPANVLLDEDAAAELDEQSGVSTSRIGRPRAAAPGDGWGMSATGAEYSDAGGASRFFPTFRYQAKAPKAERPKVDGVSHPTVKPLALMRWLVRLVTPPGGTVLDPFAGTGTTLQAARDEGFASVGVEREPTYLPLIEQRTGAAAEHVETDPILAAIAVAPDDAAMRALWVHHHATWADVHTRAVQARLAELGATT